MVVGSSMFWLGGGMGVIVLGLSFFEAFFFLLSLLDVFRGVWKVLVFFILGL